MTSNGFLCVSMLLTSVSDVTVTVFDIFSECSRIQLLRFFSQNSRKSQLRLQRSHRDTYSLAQAYCCIIRFRRKFIRTLFHVQSKRVKKTLESIVEMYILINFQDGNAPELQMNTQVEIFGVAMELWLKTSCRSSLDFHSGVKIDSEIFFTFKKFSLDFCFTNARKCFQKLSKIISQFLGQKIISQRGQLRTRCLRFYIGEKLLCQLKNSKYARGSQWRVQQHSMQQPILFALI